MAYITTEEVKEIRNNIKKEFSPKDGWKISVKQRHHSQLCVTILEAPYKITDKGEESVNHYYIEEHNDGDERKIKDLSQIYAIMSKNHWDESDMRTDYFNCAYYMSLKIGQWDRPFKVSNKIK